MGTVRRDQIRAQTTPTTRSRRERAAALREQELRDHGSGDRELRERDDDTRRVTTVRRRKPLGLKRILLLVVLAALAVLVVGSVLAWQRISAFNDKVSTAPAASSALFGALNGKDRVNVLMIGYSGDPHHGGEYLADSLNILSIDPVTNTTTMVPIPRDLWIEGVAQLPSNGKVNEAFALGWARGGVKEAGSAAATVLSAVTGLHIDHWMAIDFAGFSEMVDAVGGVAINNPRAFSYTWSEPNFLAAKWTGGTFKKGTLHLHGKLALDYARSRYTSVPAESSDFARSVRQERIMSALRAKLGAGGIGSIGPGLGLMDALQGRLKTDLSAVDLFLLSSHLQPDQRIELKEDVILRAARNSAGSYILVVIGRQSSTDYAPLESWLRQQLAKPMPASPSASPSAARGG